MPHHRVLLRLFAASCAGGFLLGLLHGGPETRPPPLPPPPPPPPPPLPPAGDLAALYPAWLRRQGLRRAPRGPGRPEAAELAERVSVLCAVREDEARRGAEAVRRTWLPRCSAAVSYGRQAGRSVTGAAAAGPDRLRALLRRLHGRLSADGHHWLLLATDSSYVVMPNLHRLLAALSPDEPHYLGQPAAVAGRQLNLAAAGLLLSRAAVRLLYQAETEGRFSHLHPALAEEAALGETPPPLPLPPPPWCCCCLVPGAANQGLVGSRQGRHFTVPPNVRSQCLDISTLNDVILGGGSQSNNGIANQPMMGKMSRHFFS